MVSKYRRKADKHIQLAKEHISDLFKFASQVDKQSLKNRYVSMARKIAMKFKIRLTSAQKRSFCKYCYSFLTSENSKRRLKDGILYIKCESCNKTSRIPYNKPKPVKKRVPIKKPKTTTKKPKTTKKSKTIKK